MGRRPSERPTAILDAAIDAFAERGFDGATWRGIAERAGVTQSLLTYHFGDKERLWREAYRAARARKLSAGPPPEDAPWLTDGAAPERAEVERWLRAYCESFGRHPQLARMQVMEGERGSERTRWAAADSLRDDYRRFADGIERLQALGWFEGVTAHQLIYMLVGAAQYAFLVPGQVENLTRRHAGTDAYIEAHAEAVTKLFMRFA